MDSIGEDFEGNKFDRSMLQRYTSSNNFEMCLVVRLASLSTVEVLNGDDDGCVASVFDKESTTRVVRLDQCLRKNILHPALYE